MARTKTGCITCRIRRVKCDEDKPSCQRCLSTGRSCDGYAEGSVQRPKNQGKAVTLRRSPNPTLIPKIWLWNSEREAQTFDYFRTRTVAGSKALLNSKFWDGLLLERTHHDQQIKHIVLAIGALHRFYETRDAAERAYGLSYYSTAIQQTQEAIERSIAGKGDKNSILMAIILFHCLETCLGNFLGANTHLIAGMRLLENGDGTPLEATIVDTIQRLDFHAWTMSDDSAPYHPPRSAIPVEFDVGLMKNCEKASSTMIEMAKWAFNTSFNPIENPTPEDFQEAGHQRELCKVQMCKWKTGFDRLKSRQSEPSVTFDILEMYYTLNWLMLNCFSTGLETAWDTGLPLWEQILKLGERVASVLNGDGTNNPAFLSLEMGLIVPMFMTGVKCRDPTLRRKATAILRKRHWKEGMWESTGTADVVEAVIAEEESGLGLINAAQDVPEVNRVMMISARVSYDTRQVHLKLHMRDPSSMTKWIIKETLLHI